MLPAPELAEILANLQALDLQPNMTAAIIGAVLAPLLRSGKSELSTFEKSDLPRKRRAKPHGRSRSARHKRKRRRHPGPSEVRQRAIAALKANPDATNAEIAKLVKCSPSTVHNARYDLPREMRKAARKAASRSSPDSRHRAQRFLKDTLADGPMQVSDVEDAAVKAHVDPGSLEQARADLNVVVNRGNAGGVKAVQWSLPG